MPRAGERPYGVAQEHEAGGGRGVPHSAVAASGGSQSGIRAYAEEAYGGAHAHAGGRAYGVVPDRTADAVAPRVHYLVLYAVDAASGALGGGAAFASSPGLDALRKVVQRGPETRTHVLGWWRTAGRLKDDLAGLAARLDDVGAWVALDVPGAELAPLPGGNLVTWSPRERRALFFDRAVHDHPQPLIPYRLADTGGEPR